MLPLDRDLQSKKLVLNDFKILTKRILDYLPNVISGYEVKNDYIIYYSSIAGSIKFLRPINTKLFVSSPTDFEINFQKFFEIISSIKSNNTVFKPEDYNLIDSILYTISQSIGAGFDLLVNANSARKHVGNRFEELIKCVFDEIGISNKKSVLQIPYDDEKVYKCENDLILSPFKNVKTGPKNINPDEIVVSIKTTSKDRMGKMFIDKILLEKFVGHRLKVIGIFLNDVQRKESNNISFTLVSGLFMVYTKFLIPLEGIYYLDPPPNAYKEPFQKHIKPLSKLVFEDVWKLLTP